MGAPKDPAEILAERVSTGGGTYKAFGEMTAAEVRARADELSAAAGVGAMAQRVAPVAGAWRGLADQLEREGATKVADLDHTSVAERAERLWVVPPPLLG